MKKLILSWIGVAILLLNIPGYSYAETEKPVLKLEELNIQVLPEYAKHPKEKDSKQTPLLIGYHGTLMNTTDKPQKGQIAIPLPMNEENFRIGFAAEYSRDLTELNEIEYSIDEKTSTILWETKEEIQPNEPYKFVIEYYTGQLKADKDNKSLTYQFKSFSNIGLVSVIFVEPLKTESFKLTPDADSHQENGYGMNLFLYQFQGMKADEMKEFKLEYKRSETRTTMEIMDAMAGNPAHTEGAVKKNETLSIWIIISVVGGISVLAAILLIIFMKKAKKRNPVAHKRGEKKTVDFEAKKSRLRAMLLEGSITENEYNELIKKLGG
ncbi:hypothetical protein KDN24_13705 [Bacillus sp. Bva_UNVM-123]|uniref:hypothetical protein n=1 Tax=Bacillus sp. Bva_UNVM-123 TaxID=2829798 RepID=UPI00391EEC7C